jgi:hypothetical protein
MQQEKREGEDAGEDAEAGKKPGQNAREGGGGTDFRPPL